MFGLSPEHTKYLTSFRCPLCGSRVLALSAQRADGRKVRSLELAYLTEQGRTAAVTCPKCQGRWSVFANSTASVSGGPEPVVRIRETGRLEEPFLEDVREFDNRGGTTALTQTISVNEQWTQSVQLEREKTQMTQTGGSLGGGQLGSITAQVESTVQATYSITDSHQRSFSDSITFDVPARTFRHVTLRIKRIVKLGVADVTMPDGSTFELPFRVPVNLTLDWSTSDEPATVQS